MAKHSGNMIGGIGRTATDAAIQKTVTKQIDEAAATAAPCIGYALRGNKDTGALELVIAGRHPLAINGVAVVLDAINALMLASMIADGIAQGMIAGAQATAQLGMKPKGD